MFARLPKAQPVDTYDYDPIEEEERFEDKDLPLEDEVKDEEPVE